MTKNQENVSPREFQFIYDHLVPPFAAMQPILKDFSDHEAKVFFLVDEMRPYEEAFRTLIQSLRKSKEPISLESAIRLYGVQSAQDLLVTKALYENIENKAFDWNTKPSDYLPFSFQVRDEFGEDTRYFFKIFLAALTFDVLSLVNKKSGVSSKNTDSLIETQFEGALKVAHIGIEEGKHVKGLALDEYLIALILLKRTGRIIFSMIHADYSEFAQLIASNRFRSRFAHLAEQEKYQMSNNLLSCLLCKFIPGLNEMSSSLLFYDYPFMLKDHVTHTNHYDLVSLCADLQAKE